MSIQYGFFCGGDPRKFFPEYESCSEDEIRNHSKACELWNLAEARGEIPTPEACPSGFVTADDGNLIHVLCAPYGIGCYEVDDDGELQLTEEEKMNKELESLREVASWAQAVLTAWNTGDLPKECPLHKKLREVMIQHRETVREDQDIPEGSNE